MIAILAVAALLAPPFWDIPACPRDSRMRLIGQGLSMRVPKKAKVRRSGDVDFQCEAIQVPGTTSWIEACDGPHYTNGDPSHLRKTATRTDERLIRWPNMPPDWVFEYGPREVKGISTSGSRWRYIGVIGSSIQYEGLDDDAAARADVLMDTLCWANP
jgi:hypothetical protein